MRRMKGEFDITMEALNLLRAEASDFWARSNLAPSSDEKFTTFLTRVYPNIAEMLQAIAKKNWLKRCPAALHEALRMESEHALMEIRRMLPKNTKPQYLKSPQQKLNEAVDRLTELYRVFKVKAPYDCHRVIIRISDDTPFANDGTLDLEIARKYGVYDCPICHREHTVSLNLAHLKAHVFGYFKVNQCQPNGSDIIGFAILETHPEADSFVPKGIAKVAEKVTGAIRATVIGLVSD